MRKMKDSGIEWIGEIPEGWEVGQIGQLYSERRTKVSDKDYPPLSVTMKGILPQLSTAAKTDAHDDRKLVCKGDFAINSRSDRRGSCGISEQDGSISLINIVLQPRGEMNPGYYNWLFHTSMFADEFYKWGHGIVDDLWTTGWSDMKKIGVPVPSKCEQKQLAEHLNFECSNIDTILSKTRSSIEEYKKLKQAVITQAVTKGVRGERKMKDSGDECIGKIPTTYSICKLKYLLKNPLKYGANESGIPYSDSLPRYIRITDITPDGNLKYTGKLSLSEESAKDYILEDGDILFARSGATVGKTFIYYQSYGRSAYAGYLIKASLNNKVSPKFVYYYTCSSLYEIWKNSIFIQSTIQNIGADPVPKTLQEQEEIADYLDAKCAEIDGLIAKKEQLVKELESYKKSLIYEVVTGKREV